MDEKEELGEGGEEEQGGTRGEQRRDRGPIRNESSESTH
jgi:hypothetical protein